MQFKTEKCWNLKSNLTESLDTDEASHLSEASSHQIHFLAAKAKLTAALLQVLTKNVREEISIT